MDSQTFTLRLTTQQAAEVHTLCDAETISDRHMARKFAGIPAIRQLFEVSADTNDSICRMIEEQDPSMAVLAERDRVH